MHLSLGTKQKCRGNDPISRETSKSTILVLKLAVQLQLWSFFRMGYLHRQDGRGCWGSENGVNGKGTQSNHKGTEFSWCQGPTLLTEMPQLERKYGIHYSPKD